MAKTLKDFLESYDFNRAAIAKQRLANLRGSGRRVRGARIANLMRAAGLREEEITDEDILQIDEVLSKDAKAGDWIHDFVHSTNPKFEGKSKKERIKMALGAYYAKQRNEEVELDEGTYSADVERAFPGGKASGVKTHPIAPVPDKKYIKGTPEYKAHKEKMKSRTGHPTNEAVQTTHEDPLVTVHDKHGLHTHANLSVANNIFGTKVKHNDVHSGPVQVKHEDDHHGVLTFNISKHHSAAMNEALIGKQKKLDKNHNGKLDSQDFKILRKEEKEDVPFDPPYTKAQNNVKDKSGAVHTPMSRARHLARIALQKKKEVKEATQYKGLEKEPKKGLPTAVVKTSRTAVKSDTVEGWDHPADAVKKEQVSYTDFINLLEGKAQYMVKLSHKDRGHTMYKTYTAEKGEDDYDIKRRATVDHSRHGYNVDSVRRKDMDTYEADDEDAPSSSQQKRGRGRPAGSKSGARKITGTSKLYK